MLNNASASICAPLVTLALGVCASAQVALPPAVGHTHPDNAHEIRRTLLYENGFEAFSFEYILAGEDATIVFDEQSVISGARSVRLGANSLLEFNDEVLPLIEGEVYEIEFDYRVLETGEEDFMFLVLAKWGIPAEYHSDPIGLRAGIEPVEGTLNRQFRFGAGTDTSFALIGLDGRTVVDNVRIYRHDRVVTRSEPLIFSYGFPRLSNYCYATPPVLAAFTDERSDEVEAVVSRYDFINGVDIDHTYGSTAWIERMRSSNPSVTVVPDRIAFLTQNIENDTPVGDASNLEAFFNAGLPEPWFMLGVDGELLNESIWPDNVQMNHTPLCPIIDGYTFNEYMHGFLTRSIMPSGVWDGIHFDQAEFFPNPLLSDTVNGPLPPIDMDRDGRADPMDLLYEMHAIGFEDYFDRMRASFGYGRLMFGNTGRIYGNASVLKTLGGWQNELFSPYRVSESGVWDTSRAAGWYDFLRNYEIASEHTNGPRALSVQGTGRGVGEVIPDRLTGHSLPFRVNRLEPEDCRRVRLGLTSTLLEDGFFGYDLVDNSTAPQWFDEYAVDGNGVATGTEEGKWYLGQPLGEKTELASSQSTVLDLDFESDLPAGVFIGLSGFTEDPGEVIEGSRSLKTSFETPTHFLVVRTEPDAYELTPGVTYDFSAEIRVLDYEPEAYHGAFFMGIASDTNANDEFGRAILYHPDIQIGQTVTLRTSVTCDGPDSVAYLYLSDGVELSVDNVTLREGAGGVFRRDFENGVVLVNPTPDDIFVSRAKIIGPLGRTGVRRILGTQAPQINSGMPVTSGIRLKSGDGIVLLADRIDAPPAAAPAGLVAVSDAGGDSIDLTWTEPSGATNAGYVIEFKAATSADYVDFRHVGPVSGASIGGVWRGMAYDVRVRAYDYLGHLSDATPPVRVTTNGTTPSRPEIVAFTSSQAALVPGARRSVSVDGVPNVFRAFTSAPFPTQTDGIRVLVNGVPAPLRSVQEHRIDFIVPWMLDGDSAVVRVSLDGVESDPVVRPLRPVLPRLPDTTGAASATVQVNSSASPFTHASATILRASDRTPVTADAPANAGERVLLIAHDLGLTEPPVRDGEAMDPVVSFDVVAEIRLFVDGRAVEALGATLADDSIGRYEIEFEVPQDVRSGALPVRIIADDETSNIVFGEFDSTPTPLASSPACPGDCDGSGVVEFRDLLMLLSRMGEATVTAECDPDGSGSVGAGDLISALHAYGPCTR